MTVEEITEQNLPDNGVFVFGSNLSGIHGAGAALMARRSFGALQGIGSGHYGRSYALPTKDRRLEPLPLASIAEHTARFIEYARLHPVFVFYVTRIGCGLAGYKEEQISPFFRNAPPNCILPKGWRI